MSIPTSVYGIKVGTDIRLFLTGRRDWNKFLEACAIAFRKKIQDEMYAEVMSTVAQTTSTAQFAKNGSLVKDTLDTLVEDVAIANDNVPVVIMGTKTALKKLNALTDVDWRAPSQKEAVANTGILGSYEGVLLMEIPQRFADNDTATKLVDPTVLLVMPMVENKFVKFVDYGETTLEVKERGETMNDQQQFELQRRMGVGTITTRLFGTYKMVG